MLYQKNETIQIVLKERKMKKNQKRKNWRENFHEPSSTLEKKMQLSRVLSILLHNTKITPFETIFKKIGCAKHRKHPKIFFLFWFFEKRQDQWKRRRLLDIIEGKWWCCGDRWLNCHQLGPDTPILRWFSGDFENEHFEFLLISIFATKLFIWRRLPHVASQSPEF